MELLQALERLACCINPAW